jgi:hypothetical protein
VRGRQQGTLGRDPRCSLGTTPVALPGNVGVAAQPQGGLLSCARRHGLPPRTLWRSETRPTRRGQGEAVEPTDSSYASSAYKSARPQPRLSRASSTPPLGVVFPPAAARRRAAGLTPASGAGGGRLTATCPCRACRYRACPYWACHGGVRRPCRYCHARCWIGLTAWCAGCPWTHRHRLTSQNQPAGTRWVGCSADERPAPRPVPAPGPRPPRWSPGLRRPSRGQRRQGPPVVPPRPPGSGRDGEGIAR